MDGKASWHVYPCRAGIRRAMNTALVDTWLWLRRTDLRLLHERQATAPKLGPTVLLSCRSSIDRGESSMEGHHVGFQFSGVIC